MKRRIARHIANLASTDKATVLRAERYLIYYGVRALPHLIEACGHASPEVRLRAGWALAHTRHADAFDTILRLCSDTDERVRYDCRVALGILGDDRSCSELIRMIEDEDHEVGAAHLGLNHMLLQCFPAIEALFRRSGPDIRYSLIDLVGIGAKDHCLPAAIELLNLAAGEEHLHLKVEAQFWLERIAAEAPDCLCCD